MQARIPRLHPLVTDAAGAPSTRSEVDGDEIRITNHDDRRGYAVTLRVYDPGSLVYRHTFHLAAGSSFGVKDVLEPGRYYVIAALDTGACDARECVVGPSLTDTVGVECGNGVVCLSQPHP